jgi:hypothetical protein
LAVTESVLAADAVVFARERIDRLFDRWCSLPRRSAPRDSADESPPAVARIHRPSALDPAIAHCELLETCRGLAQSTLESNKVWCRFDGAVYKHPGAGNVDWHQDVAATTLGAPKRSVHFWIPLNDHADNAGSLIFIPGSHKVGQNQSTLSQIFAHLSGRVGHPPDNGSPVGVPLSVGNFSIHTPWTTHGSRPNYSRQVRKALILEFSPGTWSAARQLGPALVRTHFPSAFSNGSVATG